MITPSPQINKTFDAPLAARPIPIRTGSLSPTPSPARSRAAGLRQATSLLGMRGLQGISHLRSLTMTQKGGSVGGRSGGGGGGSGSSSGASSSSGGASRKGLRERPLVIGTPFFDPEEARDSVTGLPPRFCALPSNGTPMSLPALGPRSSAIRIPFLEADEFNELHSQTLSLPQDAEPQKAEPVYLRSNTSSALSHRAHSSSSTRGPNSAADEFNELHTQRFSHSHDAEVQKAEHMQHRSHSIHSHKAQSSNSTRRKSARYTIDKRIGGIELWNVPLDVKHDDDHDALRDALDDHPDPLSSNPTSEHDESEPATPGQAVSPSSDFGNCGEFNPYWPETSTPSPKRRPRAFDPARTSVRKLYESPSALSSAESAHHQTRDPCVCETILPCLQREIANVRAGNNALLTLKAAHEETIALLHDNIRNHDNAIARLTWQVQSKETEQLCIVENFCEEMSSRNREIELLREDKSYLMGEIEQLEKKIAKLDGAIGFGMTRAAQGGSTLRKAGDSSVEGIPDRKREVGVFEVSSSSNCPSPDQQMRSSQDLLVPSSMRSSLFAPRPSSSISNRSLYAATLSPDVYRVPSTRGSTNTDGENCPRKHNKHESGLFQPNDDVSDTQAVFGRVNRDRHSRDSEIMAAQIVLAAKATLENALYTTQKKLAASEAHSQELQVQLADHTSLCQQRQQRTAEIKSPSSALMLIPDLPVLTYNQSSAVWIDRILTSFKYLGLLDFVQRDVPRPETSSWDATEVAEWTLRRLRAVVLLKHAVDDEILEDVLHLCRARDKAPSRLDFNMPTPALEDPHQLFATITCLRRIVPSSPTDLSWLDRIEDSDFEGIEGFTSLMLCIDKRHGVMYGPSADHYDALLPKLQETMSRRFPELKSSTFAVGTAEVPKKWRQLSVWMAKVSKSRQISEAC